MKRLLKSKAALCVVTLLLLAAAISVYFEVYRPAGDIKIDLRGNIAQVIADPAGNVVALAVLDKKQGSVLVDITRAKVISGGAQFSKHALQPQMEVFIALEGEIPDVCAAIVPAAVVLVR